ncbi:MAG: hypothetical protein IKB28_00955 [Clostridia bacterium]|nr:hypothetical protein [Clostridia bacterium]
MKNRKTIIVGFILVACMIMGVGYAVLTDSLEVGGTAEIKKDAAEDAFDFDVRFTNATAVTPGNTTSINADNDDKVSFTASSLAEKDDVATFEYEVTNSSDLIAKIASTDIDANVTTLTADDGTVTTPSESIFEVTYSWNTETIAANGGTAILTVHVKLKETPTVYAKGTFTLTISVISEE